MRKTWPVLIVALWALGGACAWGANHVLVESQSVAPGATGVQIGVYVENDLELNGLVIPLEIREVTATGAFPTNTLTLDAANRLTTSLIGFVTKYFYPDEDNTNPTQCSGAGFATKGALDFVSPDGVLYSAISVLDPCLPIGTDGAPPGGTPSLIFTFDVTSVDGLFVIDTTCVTPANYLLYVDCVTSGPVEPMFTAGVITVGTPAFPPEVGDIPDQTIDEGETFATIALDDFVTDLDSPDAEIIWTAAGETELIVSISPTRVATIAAPHPDWFGSETITFTATDPDDQWDSDAATFTVNPVNDPPVLSTIGAKTVLAGKYLTFYMSSSDIDNTTLDLTMENAPPAATLSPDGTGGGTFGWLTGCADEGVHTVLFIVSDGSLADSENVAITVLPNPDTLQASKTSIEFTYQFEGAPPTPVTVQITDPGCGELPWGAVASEPWLLLNPGSGTTPSALELSVDTTGLTVGEYDAIVIVTEQTPDKTIVASVEIAVHLAVVGVLCNCDHTGDPIPDYVTDVLDLVVAVKTVFRDMKPVSQANCPFVMMDVNCDCVYDILDIVILADHVFRDVTDPYCSEEGPCGASEPPGPCSEY
ncbi:MAG TPA: hypothetical protein VM118_00175 [Acidobacteriota bacterium]|nr:hypothetical protein [Acidobacteriota bacterium]